MENSTILTEEEWEAFMKQINEPISEEKKKRIRESYLRGLEIMRQIKENGYFTHVES